MATNKNQHFVPKCYLKPFTKEGNGKAINLFNIDQRRIIPNVSVKGQCAKDRFYGEDPAIERVIQTIERFYGIVMAQLRADQVQFLDNQALVFKKFWLLQYFRTDAACRRIVAMTEGQNEYLGLDDPNYRTNIRDAVDMAMSAFTKYIRVVDDLHACIVRNRTQTPFITSDDPAILTNRWCLTHRRLRHESFGLGSAGVVLLLPISPTLLFLAYDPQIYLVTSKNGFADVNRANDVQLFNEHQYLNCRANVFVRSRDEGAFVIDAFEAAKARRPETRHKLDYAVLDETRPTQSGEKVFKVVDHKTAKRPVEAIVRSQVLHPTPSAWPSLLRSHPTSKAFVSANGQMFVRRARVPFTGGFRSIRTDKL